MKRLFTTLILLFVICGAQAQTDNGNVIQLDQTGDKTISSKNGNLSVSLAGMNFEFSSDDKLKPHSEASKSGSKVHLPINFSYAGGSKTKIDHIAIVELGFINTLANANYNVYNGDFAAQQLPFTNRKSISIAINPLAMSVALNKMRTLSLEMALGFSIENYVFANNYTMEYKDGMMMPVELPSSIKKSKLVANYMRVPIIINWNIKRKLFIGVGVNAELLISSWLSYKKPKTVNDSGEITLNPLQIGGTVRFGWGKTYAFINYSFLDMFKTSTGPVGNRMSAGVGLFF